MVDDSEFEGDALPDDKIAADRLQSQFYLSRCRHGGQQAEHEYEQADDQRSLER